MRKARCFIFTAVAIAWLGAAGAGMAADDTESRVQPDTQPQAPRIVPPPPPEALTKGEEIKPGVTIVDRDWAEFQEYSVGGRVYAVKVIPKWGPPYWLYDSDGNGSLEMRGDFLHEIPPTVQWQILTW